MINHGDQRLPTCVGGVVVDLEELAAQHLVGTDLLQNYRHHGVDHLAGDRILLNFHSLWLGLVWLLLEHNIVGALIVMPDCELRSAPVVCCRSCENLRTMRCVQKGWGKCCTRARASPAMCTCTLSKHCSGTPRSLGGVEIHEVFLGASVFWR